MGNGMVANPAILAPMSGVTDTPFRRLAAALGAGLVVSEMTASAALVQGRPAARLRAEGQGLRPHVVQLAGLPARRVGGGAALGGGRGAPPLPTNICGSPPRRATGRTAAAPR